MESSGLTLHGLPEPSGADDVPARRLGGADDAPAIGSGSPTDQDDPDEQRLAAGPQLELVRGALDPDSALSGASERTNTDRRRRFVMRAEPTIATEPVDLGPTTTPAVLSTGETSNADAPVELLTPPDYVTAPQSENALERVGWDVPHGESVANGQVVTPESLPVEDAPAVPAPRSRAERRAQERVAEPVEDLLPLPAEARIEPEDPGPPGPFGGPAARDYRYAVADRLPRAIRLLMPAPAVSPEALTRSHAIESGSRRSDLELRISADRARRGVVEAEARSIELRRQAAIARDQAYEARATWQWSSHQRSALAEELNNLTAEANTVAEEQRRLSEQARRAMRDVTAWDAWIGQLREEATRLGEAGQQADAEAARARAEQGQGQVDQLRDWLDRAEQRFRQLSSHLDALAQQRDVRAGAAMELAARQQLLVDRYQRLGSEAQRMDKEASEQANAAIVARLDARERLIDLAGLRPDLSRWVNGTAVTLVREGGRHAADAGRANVGAGRRYDVPAGYRRPTQAEHAALELALPRTPEGGFQPAPEPTAAWLTRLNGVGTQADQSRAQNCVDATLALLDTYVRARPRVAVPRIVDAHRSGTTRLPLRGEPTGRRRLEDAVDGNLQLLFVQSAPMSSFRPPSSSEVERPQQGPFEKSSVQTRFETYQVHAAFDTVADQLRRAGAGSLAILVTGWQDGDSRTSAAVNHEGVVRWVDAQLGTVNDVPVPAEWVRSIEVLMVDGSGQPVPVPGMPLSPWTTRTASTAYAVAVTEPAPSGFPPPPVTDAAL